VRPESNRVRVIVEDTGSGIAPEQQPFIFQWPSRGGKIARPSGEGAGLGLAIARRIVELHGGQISMESQIGVGSRFQFDLPLQDGSQPADYSILE
jgi:signal transduction histidine kinase